MKTQISRDSFTSDKRYSGVYLQQGRMITDADWNEDAEIAKRRLDDALADTVVSGVPRAHGLQIQAVAGQPLALHRGRLYADGVGALVTSTRADPAQAFRLSEQTDLPLPAGVTPPTVSYRLYADVWERAVTSLEDPAQLRDPALHGADTGSRTQTMAQLKWCAPATDPEDPAANPPLGDAELTLTLRRQTAGLDPCDPCARDITVPPRIGNYLFRLEVHAVEGGPKNPTRLVLKWSSENGAEQHAAGGEPADFKGGDWTYEYFSARTEHLLGVHLAGGILPPAGQHPEGFSAGVLVEGFPAAPPAGSFPFVRRWDGYCILGRQGAVWSLAGGRERGVGLATDSDADADGHVALAGGSLGLQLSTLTLALDLTDQTFVAGDYWIAAVREAIHAPGDAVLSNANPAGVHHHYLLLATIDASGAAVPPDTNRQQRLDFPSLTSLAAKDVDYTANCPSGLFTAADDTVQKALDRVCSINATQVGFTKPCDTSVFKGVSPASINTVAKALALLCAVTADQISYANKPGCTALTGATTVQQALDLLCLRESGGGCRTTIGVGGDFPNLALAVKAFLQRGETRFCFCLLPGEHDAGGEISFDQGSGPDGEPLPPTFFALEGCGPASLLRPQNGLEFIGIASVRFSNFAIEMAAGKSLTIDKCEEAVIEGCTITILDHGAAPAIQMDATRTLRFAGNEVTALTTSSNLKSAVSIFAAEPSLSALFSSRLNAAEFARAAATASTALAKQTAAKRRDLATAIARQLTAAAQKLDGSPGLPGQASFQKVIDLLPTSGRTLDADLTKALAAVRSDLISDPSALAMVIFHSGADITLVDNYILGKLSFYDPPGEIVLTDAQLTRLRQLQLQGQIRLSGGGQKLVLTRNRVFGEIRLAGNLIIALRDATAQGARLPLALTNLLSIRLTDNFFGLGIDLLGTEATLAGNRMPDTARSAMVIANTAFYTGNHAAPSDGVFKVLSLALQSNAQTRDDLNAIVIKEP